VPPSSLRDFLERSLATLASEAPDSYARLSATLAGRRIGIAGDDRPFAVQFLAGRALFLESDGSEHVLARVDRSTLFGLLDGNLRLEEALRQDRLVIRANVDDAADAFDAMLIYLRGAMRCPSSPVLLAQFRASAM
jgi:hypothetical protein